MLIWIDDSIMKYSNLEILEKALYKISQAYYDGHHYIICSEEILENPIVIKHPKIHQALTSASRRYIEFRSIMKIVDCYAKIIDSDLNEKIVLSQGMTEYRIGVGFISSSSLYRPVGLILEDYDDSNTYEKIAHYYNRNRPSLSTKFEIINGGGSNTPKAIKRHAYHLNKDSRFHICLYDSDVKYPDGPKGTTANGIILASKGANLFFENLMINVHEVENLYTYEIIDYLIDDPNIKPLKIYLKTVQDDSLSNYRYIDFKNGIKLKSIKFPNSADEKSFAEYLCSLMNIDTTASNPTVLKCKCENRKDCKCTLAAGYQNVLQRINDNIHRLKIESFRLDHMENEWFRIGKFLTSWGLASEDVAV
jgi:hypothetical protein